MKKLAVFLLSTTLTVSHAFADSDPVVATYKGGDVKVSQVMEQFKPAFDAQPNMKGKQFTDLDKNLQETLVRGYINAQLLDKEVQNQKITSDKEFQEKLTNVTKQLAQQELIEKYLKNAVTDRAIADEYTKLAKNLEGQEEVKASHILLETEEQAKEAKQKLDKGAKFADIAKKSSKDEGTKASGGSLGYFTKGQLVPEFETKAFSMKPGQVSDPVKTQFGWHIIKVENKRPVKVPSKEEAKANIANKLNREAVEKYLQDLGSKADIHITLDKVEVKK